jgi:hypothetical protein
MAQAKLNVMPFCQRWDGEHIMLNIAALPIGNPLTAGFFSDGSAFAGKNLVFRCYAQSGTGPFELTGTHTRTFALAPATPVGMAAALFAKVGAQFGLSATSVENKSLRRAISGGVKKALPASYVASSGGPSRNPAQIASDREYGCELRKPAPAQQAVPEGQQMSWGKVISYALKQPTLCERLGLIYTNLLVGAEQVGEPLGSFFAAGGWLAATVVDTLVPANEVRLFRVYVPPVKQNLSRPLFSAVLLPAVASSGGLDDAVHEANEFDDGFASIVHAFQPNTIDPATEHGETMAAGVETGIRLGWDDEQILAWHNRQLDVYRQAQLNPGVEPQWSSTLGVAGYRIDVRETGAPIKTGWASLCYARWNPASTNPVVPDFNQGAAVEFSVAVAPQRQTIADAALFLPRYFATWRGGSLVAQDPQARRFVPELASPAFWLPVTDGVASSTDATSPISAAVPKLRYGHEYAFRVRYCDLTGGGPQANDAPVNPAPCPIAGMTFHRTVRPKSLRIEMDGLDMSGPGHDVPVQTKQAPSWIKLKRPALAFPEFTYAGDDDASAIEALWNHYKSLNQLSRKNFVFGMPDRDVTHALISVQVRVPGGDIANPLPRDDDFVEVHRRLLPFAPRSGFPVSPGSNPTQDDAPLEFALIYKPISNIFAAESFESDSLQEIIVPKAREVRIIVRAACAVDTKKDYFDATLIENALIEAEGQIVLGLPAYALVRDEETISSSLVNLGLETPDMATAMLIRREADNPAQLVAHHLRLEAVRGDPTRLCARRGERVVFSASAALRHVLAHGGAQMQFASLDELKGRWLVAIETTLNCDWTWNALAVEGIVIEHRNALGEWVTKGAVRMPFAVDEAQCGSIREATRTQTRIVFLDAIAPHEISFTTNPVTHFAMPLPHVPTESWRVRVVGSTSELQLPAIDIDLPYAVGPAEIPRIVSAGIAHSQPSPSNDYASLDAPAKALWLEFEHALPVWTEEPNLGFKYFARVLGYGPDPLITPQTWLSPFDRREPAIPLDDEEIRVIRPTQLGDEAGYAAMQEMVPENPRTSPSSTKRWLLPLPPGLADDAAELLGFWTYELRIGFGRGMWTTAQARFGRPMRVVGVQHPSGSVKAIAYRETKSSLLKTVKPEAKLFQNVATLTRDLHTKLSPLPPHREVTSDMAAHRIPAMPRPKIDPAIVNQFEQATREALTIGKDDVIVTNLASRDIVVKAAFAYAVGDGGPMNYERIDFYLKYGLGAQEVVAGPYGNRFPFKPATDLWAMLYAQVRQADGLNSRNVLLGQKRLDFAGDPIEAMRDISEWYGKAVFKESEVLAQLHEIGLDKSASLSVTVVELLPNAKAVPDPLGSNLGTKRILRTSDLIPVALAC